MSTSDTKSLKKLNRDGPACRHTEIWRGHDANQAEDKLENKDGMQQGQSTSYLAKSCGIVVTGVPLSASTQLTHTKNAYVNSHALDIKAFFKNNY